MPVKWQVGRADDNLPASNGVFRALGNFRALERLSSTLCRDCSLASVVFIDADMDIVSGYRAVY